MSESVLQMTGPMNAVLALSPLRSGAALGETAMNQLKTAVHHELIKRMDLDKLASLQNDPVGPLFRM